MRAEEDVLRSLAMTRLWGASESPLLVSTNLSFNVNSFLGSTVQKWERLLSSSDVITITPPQGLSSLIGKYNDDLSWEGFEDFLRQYRAEIDRLNE